MPRKRKANSGEKGKKKIREMKKKNVSSNIYDSNFYLKDRTDIQDDTMCVCLL